MISITGILEYVDIGVGSWNLDADGVVYQLNGFTGNAAQHGETITLQGEVANESMDTAMSGNNPFNVDSTPIEPDTMSAL